MLKKLTLFGLCQWAMPIAVSPDQKFGFRIEKLAFWVASKWSLDQFCLGFFFLKINSANWFCQNNRGSQGDNEKGMGQGCWGGVGVGGWGGAQPLLPRWSPFGDFGPHGDQNEFFGPHLVPIYFQSPHFLHFRLKNASKVSAATI